MEPTDELYFVNRGSNNSILLQGGLIPSQYNATYIYSRYVRPTTISSHTTNIIKSKLLHSEIVIVYYSFASR